jgi:hypothetical protein
MEQLHRRLTDVHNSHGGISFQARKSGVSLFSCKKVSPCCAWTGKSELTLPHRHIAQSHPEINADKQCQPHSPRGLLNQNIHTTINFLIRGLIIGFSIAAPLGPIGLLCIRRTLVHFFILKLMF